MSHAIPSRTVYLLYRKREIGGTRLAVVVVSVGGVGVHECSSSFSLFGQPMKKKRMQGAVETRQPEPFPLLPIAGFKAKGSC